MDDACWVVKVPPDMVEKWIRQAPTVIQLCGRAENGELDCEIGGMALNVEDPGSTEARRSKLEDIVNMAGLVDALIN